MGDLPGRVPGSVEALEDLGGFFEAGARMKLA